MAASVSGEVRHRWRAQALVARLVSGFLLAPIALGVAWLGGWPLAALLLLVLGIGLIEFYRMAAGAGIPVLTAPGVAAAAVLIILAAVHEAAGAGVVFLAIGMWMLLAALRPPLEGRLIGLAVTVFGVLYVVGLGIHILWLRELPNGPWLLLVTLAATWASDIFAFLIGVRWGRRRLAPHISPGKSVEGVIAGFLGSILVVALLALTVSRIGLDLGPALLVGAVLGVASPLGDLVESLIKRNLKAKDASRVIPGHGGVLDRIDSLLLTAPVAFYLFRHLLAES